MGGDTSWHLRIRPRHRKAAAHACQQDRPVKLNRGKLRKQTCFHKEQSENIHYGTTMPSVVIYFYTLTFTRARRWIYPQLHVVWCYLGADSPRLAHLLSCSMVVDFGIVAESWSILVHGRCRRADQFGRKATFCKRLKKDFLLKCVDGMLSSRIPRYIQSSANRLVLQRTKLAVLLCRIPPKSMKPLWK